MVAAWILFPHSLTLRGKKEAFTILGFTGPEKRRPTLGIWDVRFPSPGGLALRPDVFELGVDVRDRGRRRRTSEKARRIWFSELARRWWGDRRARRRRIPGRRGQESDPVEADGGGARVRSEDELDILERRALQILTKTSRDRKGERGPGARLDSPEADHAEVLPVDAAGRDLHDEPRRLPALERSSVDADVDLDDARVARAERRHVRARHASEASAAERYGMSPGARSVVQAHGPRAFAEGPVAEALEVQNPLIFGRSEYERYETSNSNSQRHPSPNERTNPQHHVDMVGQVHGPSSRDACFRPEAGGSAGRAAASRPRRLCCGTAMSRLCR